MRCLPLLIFLLLFGCTPTTPTVPLSSAATSDELTRNFQAPPAQTKPWLYWYWINNHASAEGITRDLETMADLGIGAALIGNIYLKGIAQEGSVPTLSPEWKELTLHAIREGGRLGVDIGLFNSPGWSQSGGPWNDTDNSMRYLDGAFLQVSGPGVFRQELPRPDGDFTDVAVLAYPTPATGTAVKISDIDLSGKQSFTVDLSGNGEAMRSLTLRATGTLQADALLEYHDPGGSWRDLRRFRLDRSNNMEQISFADAPPLTVAFPATRAEAFRLRLNNVRPTRGSKTYGLSEVTLSPAARLEFATEKQLALMHQTPLPLADAYRWPDQAEPEAEWRIPADRVIDLSDRLADDGTLDWEVPAGEWTILRTGMRPTGVSNGPAAPTAIGPEVDKLNKEKLAQHFDAFIGDILSALTEEEKKAFKYVVADSYETGGQNWTDGFADDFREAFNYDPLPWLPVLTGAIVGSVEQSNRFLWDLRRIVADRVAYEYVGGLRELCEANGLKLWLENYGHWGFPSEFLTYGGQSNFISGEFWNEGDLGSIECRAAASAAHIYGKEQVSAESFTAAGRDFQRYPAILKKRGDWSFTEGINHRVYHVYIHQPYADKQPGVNAWFGTEFNRHNTWFPQAKPWIDYERRCGYLLRQGRYVADIAYFIGEDAPKMTGVTDPAVPRGYSFDYINAEVLRERSRVEDGRIRVEDGPAYRILVLPPSETMRPEILERIAELVRQGATVVGSPPARSPSLEDFGTADGRVAGLARQLWDNTANGDGQVLDRADLGQLLKQIGTPGDLLLRASPDTEVLWIHRSTPTEEIYFLSNQQDTTVDFVAAFRVDKSLRPQWYTPTTGDHRPLPEFRATDDHLEIPLRLAPYESGFVVFRLPSPGPAPSGKNYPGQAEWMTIAGPWAVTFTNDHLGIDREETLAETGSWTALGDEELRHFSGTAVYRTSFTLPADETGKRVLLDIGRAGVIASVRLNGRLVGGLWTVPWQLDVTEALRPGENRLEIEVTNTWANALIRDAGRSEADKKTWVLTPNKYEAGQELYEAGLIGPVRLLNELP